MFYKNIIFLTLYFFLTNCTIWSLEKSKFSKVNTKSSTVKVNPYTNKGFALIYNKDLFKKKLVNKQLDERSLIIFQKNLKINTRVKITNILNNKSLIVTVGQNSRYPTFNNAVLSKRIAEELDLDINQPYIEIIEILQNSFFVADKAKTFDEERNVAVKAPVNNININDLSIVKKKKEKNSIIKFSYIIKIADFYFNDSAQMMLNRIKLESPIKNPKIKKISDKKYRVYLGPFSNINSLQNSYNDISILEFENIEIIEND